MKTFSSSLVLFLVLVSNCFSQTYQLTDLGVFVGTNSYAQGINNQSQVVGYWETLAGAHAFLYQAGTVTDLGLLGGVATNSYALSINNQGQVVGFAEATNGSSAFLYRDGNITNLGTWYGSGSYAFGISGDGHIIGYVDTPNGARASLYFNNNVVWLGTLGGTNSMAFAINDALQVVGSSLTTNNAATHAFLWQNGSMIDLNQLMPLNGGWQLTEARGINASGQIVGWGQINNQEHAFFYKSGSIADLGLLSGGSNSFAFGLNNSNSVVGTASSVSGTHAFLWQGGFINDLNDLINPSSGWELREAWGINDSGQIVGWGVVEGRDHAFLLTPTVASTGASGSSITAANTLTSQLTMAPLVGSLTVTITNPVNNATFLVPTNITINATTSDSSGTVTQVQFLVGTRLLGVKTNSPYSVIWSNAPVGIHALTAIATDNTGLTGTSSVVNVSISTNLLPIADSYVRDGAFTNSNFGTTNILQCLTTTTNGNNRDIYFKFDLTDVSNISSAKLNVFAGLGGSGAVSNTVYSVTNTSWLETNITWNNKPARVTALTTNSVTGTNWYLFDVTGFIQSQKNVGSNVVSLALHDPTNYTLLISINSRENTTNQPALLVVTTNSPLSVSITNPVNNALFAAPTNIAINAGVYDSDGTVTQVLFFQGTNNLGRVTSAPYSLIWSNVSSGTYALMATASDSSGLTSTSSIVSVVVDIAPSITTQPTNQTVKQGSNAVFSVTAAGTAPLSYRWHFNGTNTLAGFTNASITITNVQSTNTGNYSVVVTNAVGSVTSSNAVLALLTAPAITAQPTNQTVLQGSNAVFSVTATGTAPLNYQWRLNTTNLLIGATNSSLIVTNVQSANAGNYSVVVTNVVGSVTSSNAVLTVNAPPTITTQPTNQTVKQGSNAVFSVTAAGTAPLSYRWHFNGTNTLAGFTNASITITNVQSTNTGNYSVVVTNAVGSVTSSNAVLALLTAPAITAQPTNQTVLQGSNAVFSVTATGTAPLNYQWRLNTTNLLIGATNSSLIVTNVQSANAGNYSVVVTNVVGSVTSSNAVLTVNAPPTITTQPTNQTVKQGSNAVFSVTAAGTAPLSYRWHFNGTNTLAGFTNASITITNVQSTNTGNYSVVVTNAVGSVTSSNAVLALLTAPAITAQPTNQTVLQGSNAVFSVTATGTAPLNYQWRLNTTNLLIGATNSSLIVTNVQSANAGNYSVVVTNVVGSVTSSNAVLAMKAPPVISITNPVNNAIFSLGANIVLIATASDTGGIVTQVQFFQATNSLGIVTNSPYTLVWTNPPAGTYSLTAVATDNSSLTATSSVINVIIDIPPTVTLTNPVNNAVIPAGVNVSLGASASDADGTISQVQFFQGATSLGVVTNSPYTLVWNTSTVGTNVLTVQATDNNGLMTTSAPVNLIVITPVSSMTAWWKAEGNTFDTIGTNTGVLQGGAGFTNGEVGQAFSFNGTVQAVSIPYSLTTDLSSMSAWTIEAWINPSSFNNQQWPTIYAQGYWGASLGLNSGSGNLESWINNGDQLVGTIAVPLGKWSHVALVYTGTSRIFYVNGVFAGSGDASVVSSDNNSSAIGAVGTIDSRSCFSGAIDELSIYNRALSSNEIAAIYNAGSAGKSYCFLNVTLTNPPNNSLFPIGSNINLSASVSDAIGTVTQVQFFQGTNSLGTLTNSPYNIAWSNMVSGAYAMTAVAVDNYGFAATSEVVNVLLAVPPPSITLTNPANNSVFAAGSNINLGASASDAYGTVFQVQFFQGTNSLGVSTTAPYNLIWANPPAGTYSLTAQVTDNFGLTSTSTVVNIIVDMPPTVSITSPPNGSIIAGPSSIPLTASVGDSDGTVTQVQFFQGTTILGTVTNSPYSLVWSNAALGSYVLTAVAVDNYGFSTTSSVVNVTIAPLVVSIASPANNAGFFASSTNITVTAVAGDAFGTVTQIQIFQGATSLGVATSSPYTATWSNAPAGNYSLTAVAMDNNNNTATSLVVNVTISPLFLINNCSLWLKADAITGLTNYAGVGIWSDSSGWTNNATQTTANNQPLYITNAINGLPVVQFNGTSSYFNLTDFMNGVTGAEAFVVLKAAVAQPSQDSPLWKFGDSNQGGCGFPETDGSIADNFGSTTTYYAGVQPQPLTQYNVYEVSSQNNGLAAWINGILFYQANNNTVEWNASPTLGSVYGESFFAGNIAEVLVFSRVLTPSERTMINTYLNGKYGLVSTVPATPTNLVATAISQTQISLTWGEPLTNGGATQIAIERSTTINGTFAEVAQVVNALSYVDTNLSPGMTYYYQVEAINLTQWSPTSNVAQATTPMVGASIPFGNLVLWLKADAGLVQGNTNTPVNLWLDQSGMGNNAVQTTEENSETQPVWVPRALGDLPVVQFDGSRDCFNLPNFMNGATGAEAFVVLKAAVALPSQDSPLWQLGNSSQGGLGYPATDGSIADNFGSSSTYYMGIPSQPLTQYHVYEVSSQTNNWAVWINGVLLYQANVNAVGWNSSPTLGSAGNFFAGDIAEVLVFNRVLIDDEKAVVGNYLVSKYGLSQFATNNSVPSAPTNLVAIGVSLSQLNLQWTRTSTNEMAFSIERQSGTNGTFQILGSVMNGVTNLLDTDAIPTNTYFYRVEALNYFGNSGYSAVISPPTVCLTNWPLTILENTTNSISAQAGDASGTVNNVEFFSNLALIGTATSAPYAVNWLPSMEGTWSLSALATDNQGNSQYSEPVTVTVYLDSNGDGIPDYLQVLQGNNPLNPWIPPTGGTNNVPPNIYLQIPTNAVLVP